MNYDTTSATLERVTQPLPKALQLSTWEDLDRMAQTVAKSGMFGINNPAQAICMFAIAQSEGIDPLSVLRKYHVIEGKPSMRADAMLAEFKKAGGGVIYHVRTDKVVAATYFEDKKRITAEAESRSIERMNILLSLEFDDLDPKERKELYLQLTRLNKEGEQTIIRTMDDATKKGITQGKNGMKHNWATYPKAMLAARCDTEGIRIIMPGLIAGIMETTEAIEVAAQAEEVFQVKAVEAQIEYLPPPQQDDWTNYALRCVKGMFRGMRIADMKKSDLEVLLDRHQRKIELSPDPEIQKEIDMITACLTNRED
jgi:hypothetical protein